MTIETASADETITLGRRFAQDLKPGDVVAFFGELGSGKTTMIKGICAGLSVKDTVRSPSFVVAVEYAGKCAGKPVRVNHVDLYRLHATSELSDIGLGDYVVGDGITLIEWAERAQAVLPDAAIQVVLEVKDGTRRTISIEK